MYSARDRLLLALTAIDLLGSDDFALEPMTHEQSRDISQLFVEPTGRAVTDLTNA